MRILEMISCRDFIIVEKYAYFSCRLYNAFFKVEIETGKTFFLDYFKDEELFQRNIHRAIFMKNNKIYICPRKGRHVHIWDLSSQSLHSVELRLKNEKLFLVDEVILGERSIFFLSDQNRHIAKEMDLESLVVTELNGKFDIQGECVSKYDDFPVPELLKNYQIKYSELIVWKQMLNDKWYGFVPMGCHLLCYYLKEKRLEIIPLEVVNKTNMEVYLRKIKNELLKTICVQEEIMQLQDFFEMAIITENLNAPNKENIGENIWKLLRVMDKYVRNK